MTKTSITAGKSRRARELKRNETRHEELTRRNAPGKLSPAERRELAALEASQERLSYTRKVDAARLATIGRSGKRAKDLQRVVYAAIGLDPKAGFDGAPPAFLPEREVNEASGGGQGFRNAVRDPLALLHRKGSLDDGQYQAALDFIALWEAYHRIGGRAVMYGERVDGGKSPDVPIQQMAVVAKVKAFRRFVGDDRLHLLEATCIGGNALHVVARMGRWGADYRTVLKKLRMTLDMAGRFSW